jgi:hypothetical protein
MINDQIQALEALYIAAHGKYGTLVDLKNVPFAMTATILDDLRKQQLIRTAGRGSFSLHLAGGGQSR